MEEDKDQPLAGSDSTDLKLVQRRARRFMGKELEIPDGVGAETFEDIGILAGPELVSPTSPMPEATKRSENIRTRLLDVAEFLFARWGYTGVSVRDVSDLSETRLGSVNYYFGSKQNLYLAVWERRSAILSKARMDAMQKAIDSDLTGVPFIAELADAYMMPAVEFSENGGPGWRSFFQLIGHVTFSRLWPNQILHYFNSPAERFVEGLKTRYPDISDFQAQAISLLLVGPVIYILARTGRIETFSAPAFGSDDLDRLVPEAHHFIVGGICGSLGLRYERET